ncbi:MAG: DUF424 family protein [Candidatus Micrarchaeota archaeon]
MLFMRVHVSRKENARILAVCDSELMGRVLKDGERTLDLERYGGFYKDEEASEEEVEREVARATSMNFVGERAVGIALRAGVVKESDVVYISKVPHVQVYRI